MRLRLPLRALAYQTGSSDRSGRRTSASRNKSRPAAVFAPAGTAGFEANKTGTAVFLLAHNWEITKATSEPRRFRLPRAHLIAGHRTPANASMMSPNALVLILILVFLLSSADAPKLVNPFQSFVPACYGSGPFRKAPVAEASGNPLGLNSATRKGYRNVLDIDSKVKYRFC
jgi:hypothetical protein